MRYDFMAQGYLPAVEPARPTLALIAKLCSARYCRASRAIYSLFMSGARYHPRNPPRKQGSGQSASSRGTRSSFVKCRSVANPTQKQVIFASSRRRARGLIAFGVQKTRLARGLCVSNHLGFLSGSTKI